MQHPPVINQKCISTLTKRDLKWLQFVQDLRYSLPSNLREAICRLKKRLIPTKKVFVFHLFVKAKKGYRAGLWSTRFDNSPRQNILRYRFHNFFAIDEKRWNLRISSNTSEHEITGRLLPVS